MKHICSTMKSMKWRKYIIRKCTKIGVCPLASAGRRILIQSLNVWGDSATYSCPCENTGTCKSSPTCFTDWPYDIFTVIANARWTGNWCHEKGSSKDWSDGLRVMCGIKTDDPANFPPSIQHWNTHGCISIKMSLVPLQSSIEGSRFQRSMSGHPCLSFKCVNGSPDRTKEFRNSMGYTSKWSIASSEPDAQSMLWTVTSCPGKVSRISWLIASMSSFLQHKIVWPWK